MALKLVYIFPFLFVLNTALALTCYQCDSSENKLCNSFTYNTVNCDEEYEDAVSSWIPKHCVKLVAKGTNGSEYISRGCISHFAASCADIAKTFNFFSSVDSSIENLDCYLCDEDKCNSATKYAGYTMLGVVLAAVAFMF